MYVPGTYTHSMFQTFQRMFSGSGNDKNNTKKKAKDSGSADKQRVGKVRSNNEDFSFIPITDSSTEGPSSTTQKGGNSYMNNMNNIINSQRVYASSQRSKPEVQESDEVRLSTNSTGSQHDTHSFGDTTIPKKKKRKALNSGKRTKSVKRKSLKSSTKKTPRRQNPAGSGGGDRTSTSRKRTSTSKKSASKSSRAKSNKRGGGRSRKKRTNK